MEQNNLNELIQQIQLWISQSQDKAHLVLLLKQAFEKFPDSEELKNISSSLLLDIWKVKEDEKEEQDPPNLPDDTELVRDDDILLTLKKISQIKWNLGEPNYELQKTELLKLTNKYPNHVWLKEAIEKISCLWINQNNEDAHQQNDDMFHINQDNNLIIQFKRISLLKWVWWEPDYELQKLELEKLYIKYPDHVWIKEALDKLKQEMEWSDDI